MNVTVTDPDNFLGCPAYDGPADLAWQRVNSGAYQATTEYGEPCTLLVIRSAHGTGSSMIHVPTATTEV